MLRRKLRTEEGASLMLALLFFVICAMVGSVILAAASAAAGRIAGLQQADQVKYTLESAADLLKANITGWTYKRVGNEEAKGLVWTAEGNPEEESEGLRIDASVGTGPLVSTKDCLPMLFELCEDLSGVRRTVNSTTGSDEGEGSGGIAEDVKLFGIDSASITRYLRNHQEDMQELQSANELNVVLTLSDSRMRPVLVELSLEPDYTIFANLFICKEQTATTSESESAADRTVERDDTMPTMLMTFYADFTEMAGVVLDEEGKQEEETSVTVTWREPVIVKNGQLSDGGSV